MVSKRTNKLCVPVYISKHYRCTITAGTFLYILMLKVLVLNAIKAQIAALLKMHKNDPSDELKQTITDLIFFENQL